MRRRSSIASPLPAIGRRSPCASDAAHVLFGRRLQPHGVQWREQQVEGRRLGDEPARRRDHRLGVRAAIDLVERAPLVAPVGVLARRASGSRAMLQPATARSRGSSSTNGSSSSSASMRPSVDLPAPRRPISAMRGAARRSCAGVAEQLATARRARDATSASLAAAQQLADHAAIRASCVGHVADQLGERAVERAGDLPQQPGSTRCRRRIRDSRGGAPKRRRSAPAPCASCPRRARSARTRSPRAARKGSLRRRRSVDGVWSMSCSHRA